MVQDVNEQKEIEKQLVLSAIQVLRQTGGEINPHTVATTAKIPRSTIYRNAELMDLIAHEEDMGTLLASDTESIAELEARIQHLDQTIWDLEKQNEELHTESQNAWTHGFTAGLAEAARRHADPSSEPLTAAAAKKRAKNTPTQEISVAGGETTTSERTVYTNLTDTDAHIPTLDLGQAAESLHSPPQGQVVQPAPVAKPQGQPRQVAPTATPAATPITTPQGQALPAAASVPAPPVQTAQAAPVASEGQAVQAVSLSPQAPSASAKTAEVVTPPSAQGHTAVPPGQTSPSSAGGNLGQARQASTEAIYNIARSGPYVASDFNPLGELSWKDLETVYNFRVETLIDYGRSLPSGKTPDPEPYTPPGPNGSQPKLADLIDPDILSMLPSDEEIANLQNLEAVVYMSHEEADVTPLPTESLYSQDARYQDPNATGDRLQAMNDPRFIDGQAVVDLDALDIFDDLDEYVDVDKIHVIDDVQLDQGPESGDELRELIKGRIQQAAEIQNDQTPRAMGPAAAPAAEGDGGAIGRSRSKFVGGAKAPQEPKANNFVVRQIPPEIRRACLILGLRPEELTTAAVIEYWKKQIAAPGVHPDHGGDTEAAIYLNTAKDTLVRWIDAQAPKLGKKFNKPPSPPEQGKPPNQPE
jgi:hypothetical protein